jgi:hypothetical protein
VKSNFIPPWLGSWLANIVLGALGLVMFLWRDRVADQPIRIPIPAWIQRRASVRMLPGARLLRILDRYVAASYLRFLLLAVVAGLAAWVVLALVSGWLGTGPTGSAVAVLAGSAVALGVLVGAALLSRSTELDDVLRGLRGRGPASGTSRSAGRHRSDGRS